MSRVPDPEVQAATAIRPERQRKGECLNQVSPPFSLMLLSDCILSQKWFNGGGYVGRND